MKFLYCIFLLYFCSCSIIAQKSVTQGNILRININSTTINEADTLWHWEKIKQTDRLFENECTNVFYQKEKLYLLTSYHYEYIYLSGMWGTAYKILNLTTEKEKELGLFGNVIDVLPEPYIQPTNSILVLDNGFWFLGGVLYGCTYFDNNDSTYNFNSKSETGIRLAHILGKIENDYVIAVRKEPRSDIYDYYLSTFSKLPELSLDKKVIFPYPASRSCAPISIHCLQDSFYLVKKECSSDLDLVVLSHDSLKIIKHSIANFSRWVLSGKDLVFLDYDELSQTFGLSKTHFNSFELKFEKKEKLLNNLPFVAFNDSYAAWLRSDTLFVINYKDGSAEKKYSLNGIKIKEKIFLRPPYIFLNKINSITDVIKESIVPSEYSLSQNYPNPFNPETTISYSIPASLNPSKGGTFVSLKVFDLLGREVVTLVDEYKQAGTYKVIFNVKTPYMASLPSGIYFYRLQAGSYSETKKLILMK